MLSLVAAQRRLQQAEAAPDPPSIHTLEELNAYVQARVVELDALINDCEKEVAKLGAKEKVVRAWFVGSLGGLRLARGAWAWWNRSE
jgi:hypothetical protein